MILPLLLLLLCALPAGAQSERLYLPYLLQMPLVVPAPVGSVVNHVPGAGWDHICPQCKLLGVKSRVTTGTCSCTAVYCGGSPTFDEQGNYIYGVAVTNCNKCDCDYTCTNGHTFYARTGSP